MYIKAKTITSAWKSILNAVWYSGVEFDSERGKTKEIQNLLVRVQNPYDKEIEDYTMPSGELKEYAKQLLDPKKHDFEYTYGERLRAWGGGVTDKPVDQIGEIIRRLKSNAHSRRATAVTWIPPTDLRGVDVPCLILVDFKVRDGLTHLTAVFRSNDMFGAWPANAFGLNYLNSHVAGKLGIKPGSLTTLSISAHIYEHDFKGVERILVL